VRAKPLILCIDDEAVGLKVRSTVLERAGYRVLTALDGASGLNLFQTHPIEAVILDYFMPGMDGGEVASRMREQRREVPILLLSASLDLPHDVVRTVDFTLMKGDGPALLMEKLEEMLSGRMGPEGTDA
jgi:CheY-like chemotaxis protein